MLCGISPGFPGLFHTKRQITHVLLTRTPLYSADCSAFLVRLACVKRAASVDSEPGSNSHLILLSYQSPQLNSNYPRFKIASNQIVKDLRDRPGDPKKPEPAAGLKAVRAALRRALHCERV